MEPTVCQAPILHRRQYRATSREIQGTVFHPGTVFFMRFQKTVPDTVFFTHRFLHERSSERNKLRRRADGRLSAVEPERVSRQDPPALLFYSLTGTACGFGVASGVGVATVAAGVEPFLNGKSSSE